MFLFICVIDTRKDLLADIFNITIIDFFIELIEVEIGVIKFAVRVLTHDQVSNDNQQIFLLRGCGDSLKYRK